MLRRLERSAIEFTNSIAVRKTLPEALRTIKQCDPLRKTRLVIHKLNRTEEEISASIIA